MHNSKINFSTADLYDVNENNPTIAVVVPMFQHFGGIKKFCGSIRTIKTCEDNSLVRELVREDGSGQVLVIDGGGLLTCALLGDLLAQSAFEHNWQGIIINGCIRDKAMIAKINLGVMAIAINPKKSVKRGIGEKDIPVIFGNCRFNTGEYLYADEDGIIVSPISLI